MTEQHYKSAYKQHHLYSNSTTTFNHSALLFVTDICVLSVGVFLQVTLLQQ